MFRPTTKRILGRRAIAGRVMGVRLQTASQGSLPPRPVLARIDRLVRERTRFNAGRTHRYTLFRHWGDHDDYVAFLGMNPSGADEAALDRTVAKCERFAKKWTWNGRPFGAFYMLNAFGLRATMSAEIFEAKDPVGRENDRWIREIAGRARLVVASWGNPGSSLGRGEALTALLREICDPANVRCFGVNKGGAPRHPLYERESKTTLDLEPFL